MTTTMQIEFIEAVEARLTELGWDRNKLAEKLGVTPAYVYNVLAGRNGVNRSMEKWGKVLKLDFHLVAKKRGRVRTVERRTSLLVLPRASRR